MEQIKRGNLPLVGRIQHGEQLNEGKGTRVKELGYFITKINNEYMKYLENRFNEKYPQEKKLKIRFFDENPLHIIKEELLVIVWKVKKMPKEKYQASGKM